MDKVILRHILVFFVVLMVPLMIVQSVEPGREYTPANQSGGSVDNIIRTVQSTLNTVIGILFIVATLVFLWGVIQFIASAGDETKRNKAKAVMTWGIIGLAVMAAAWGVANVLVGFFLGPGGGPVRGRVPMRPGDL